MRATPTSASTWPQKPTTASLPPQFKHVASVRISAPASLDQAAASQRCSRRKELRKKREIEAGGREEKSPGMENSPPGIQELLDMMDYDDAAEWQQICDDLREKLLRKQQKRDEMNSGGPDA